MNVENFVIWRKDIPYHCAIRVMKDGSIKISPVLAELIKDAKVIGCETCAKSGSITGKKFRDFPCRSLNAGFPNWEES